MAHHEEFPHRGAVWLSAVVQQIQKLVSGEIEFPDVFAKGARANPIFTVGLVEGYDRWVPIWIVERARRTPAYFPVVDNAVGSAHIKIPAT